MHITLIIALILSATNLESSSAPPTSSNDLFQQSSSIYFSNLKKVLKNIYFQLNKNLTLYCGCSFDSNKQIDHDSYNYSPRTKSNKRSHRLEFEHVVPASVLGKNLQFWKEPICTKKNGKV